MSFQASCVFSHAKKAESLRAIEMHRDPDDRCAHINGCDVADWGVVALVIGQANCGGVYECPKGICEAELAVAAQLRSGVPTVGVVEIDIRLHARNSDLVKFWNESAHRFESDISVTLWVSPQRGSIKDYNCDSARIWIRRKRDPSARLAHFTAEVSFKCDDGAFKRILPCRVALPSLAECPGDDRGPMSLANVETQHNGLDNRNEEDLMEPTAVFVAYELFKLMIKDGYESIKDLMPTGNGRSPKEEGVPSAARTDAVPSQVFIEAI